MNTYRPNLRIHPLDAHERALRETYPELEPVSIKPVIGWCLVGAAVWAGILYWLFR